MYGTNDGAPGQWTARAVNQVGTSDESAKTNVHVIAPTVAITSPAPGATVPGPSFAVTVAASPDPIGKAAVAYVQVCVVGAWCDTDDTAPYAFTVSASSGATTLRATAFDEAGGRATVDAPVTVVDTPPSVQLTAPTPGSQVSTGEPFAVTASASPNPFSGSPVQYVTFELRDSGGNVVDFAEAYEAPFAASMTAADDGHTPSQRRPPTRTASRPRRRPSSDRSDTRTRVADGSRHVRRMTPRDRWKSAVVSSVHEPRTDLLVRRGRLDRQPSGSTPGANTRRWSIATKRCSGSARLISPTSATRRSR